MSPNEIGYFAFTRKAAHEARDRAVARFTLDPEKDFVYFRTLHSLAFQMLGMTGSQVLGDRNLSDFGKKTGVDLSSGGSEHISDDGFVLLKSNNPVMRAIDLARNSMKGARHAYNHVELSIPFYEFEHLFKEYERFKHNNGLRDFTDMMVELSEKPSAIPRLKVCFLDEAQDLTPLQWKVAHLLNDKSDRMFVAGDDDQGIYRWAGADINHFVTLDGGSEVLSQSYRVPRNVHTVANNVVQRIRYRQKKSWLPRTESGSVERVYDPSTVSFNGDNWLILAQANYMLDELADRLTSNGQYFERKGHASLKKNVRNAISTWNHIQSSPAFGLEATDGEWDTVLDRISDEDRVYASALLNRGVNIFEKPKIKLSTIHGAKGGEADNVLLYLDLSTKALHEMEKNPDDAHRVLYVGLTRAKQNLVLKMPEDPQRGWAI